MTETIRVMKSILVHVIIGILNSYRFLGNHATRCRWATVSRLLQVQVLVSRCRHILAFTLVHSLATYTRPVLMSWCLDVLMHVLTASHLYMYVHDRLASALSFSVWWLACRETGNNWISGTVCLHVHDIAQLQRRQMKSRTRWSLWCDGKFGIRSIQNCSGEDECVTRGREYHKKLPGMMKTGIKLLSQFCLPTCTANQNNIPLSSFHFHSYKKVQIIFCLQAIINLLRKWNLFCGPAIRWILLVCLKAIWR